MAGPMLVVPSRVFIALQLLRDACVEIVAACSEKSEAVSVFLRFTWATRLLWGRRNTKQGKFSI